MSPSSFRFTIVGPDGTVSFVAPAYALKMVAAACGKGAESSDDLIEGLGEYDPTLAQDLRSGLDRDDRQAGEVLPPDPVRPFRVVDDATRAAAQQPVSAGLIVVNLPEKRIVQVQNSYADLKREDRGRMRRNGRALQLFYRYELPAEWQIVP
jgi:hypothetical protein